MRWLLLMFLLKSAAVQDRPVFTVEALEARIFELVNIERQQRQLKPLKIDTKLINLARAHSRDMGQRSYFDHVNPNGKSPADRGRAAGIPCRKWIDDSRYSVGVAENIFQNNLYSRVIFRNDTPTYVWNSLEDIALTTVKGWMNSPGHRQVILADRYLTTGVGAAIAPNDQVLITQEFC